MGEGQPKGADVLRRVALDDTAAAFGTMFPPAASTPFVLGLAEVTCHKAVANQLREGETTVGVRAEIEHMAPSPVGAELAVHAELVQSEGGRLTFAVVVKEDNRIVARVSHQRAIVDTARILRRLERN